LNAQIGAHGPLVDVLVGVSEQRAAALISAGSQPPSDLSARALIDTGASCTAVDAAVINRLELSPTGITSIVTPSTGGTPHRCNEYDISLWLVSGVHSVRRTIPIVETNLAASGFEVLLGRDVLDGCVFVYNGAAGTFSLSF